MRKLDSPLRDLVLLQLFGKIGDGMAGIERAVVLERGEACEEPVVSIGRDPVADDLLRIRGFLADDSAKSFERGSRLARTSNFTISRRRSTSCGRGSSGGTPSLAEGPG